jgi:hypothetical protein
MKYVATHKCPQAQGRQPKTRMTAWNGYSCGGSFWRVPVNLTDSNVAMKHFRTESALSLLMSCLACLVITSCKNAPNALTADKTVNRILDGCPIEIETCAVAHDFPIPNLQNYKPDLETELQLSTVRPLHMIRGGQILKGLAERRVAYALEISRAFRHPNGLGLMPYIGCHMLFLRDSDPQKDHEIQVWIEKEANATMHTKKTTIYFFKQKYEDDLWEFYLTFIDNKTIFCATEKAWLETMMSLCGNDDASTGRTFKQAFPYWQYCNLNANYWAVRKFAHLPNLRDISSPRTGSFFPFDPAAKAVIVQYVPGVIMPLTITYISENPKYYMDSFFQTLASNPAYRELPSASAESRQAAVVRIGQQSELAVQNLFMFIALFFLGHGEII